MRKHDTQVVFNHNNAFIFFFFVFPAVCWHWSLTRAAKPPAHPESSMRLLGFPSLASMISPCFSPSHRVQPSVLIFLFSIRLSLPSTQPLCCAADSDSAGKVLVGTVQEITLTLTVTSSWQLLTKGSHVLDSLLLSHILKSIGCFSWESELGWAH